MGISGNRSFTHGSVSGRSKNSPLARLTIPRPKAFIYVRARPSERGWCTYVYQDGLGVNKAKIAIQNAKKDIVGHPQADRFGGFIDQLGGQLNTPAVGDVMDIKFVGLDGKETDLSKMKGKVVLIDFWATWCGPCIAELPNVIKAYEDYNDEGFEIIGISLDNAKDEDKLKAFVKDKKMTWAHAFDGQGWGNALAKKFGITSIPATFLIGKDGKVVASNLRGPALEKAVKKELGL